MLNRRPLFALLLITLLAVGSAQAQSGAPAAPVKEIAPPAAAGSSAPNLFATADGRIFLIWIEQVSEGRHALKFAAFEKATWTAPRVIAEGEKWFVNWADFPMLVALDEKTLVAHWLVKSAADTYAYDIHVSRSSDGGKSWSKPLVPHRDHTPTEHGFVTLLPLPQKKVGAIWLDGRKLTAKGGAKGGDGHGGHGSAKADMTMRYATLDGQGNLADEAEVDARTCECCQTSAAITSQGLIVAYRDRSDAEVRDISVARLVDGRWTSPQTVHADNWQIQGCPVNGPSVAADGRQVVVAWFTAANDRPLVKAVFSNDAGATFSRAIQVDDGKAIGRVETLMLADGSALVVWLEKTDKGADIRARRVYADGRRSASLTIAESSAGRSSGFPQMARSREQILFAWTEAGKPTRIRAATVKLDQFK